jgi:hypothetical protein
VPRLPAVICSQCGELKLPKQGCENEKCRRYRPSILKLKVASANERRKRARRLQYMRRYNASFAKKSKKQRHIHFRMIQFCFGRMLNLFEADSQAGRWTLYEDRIQEAQEIISDAHLLYRASIKHFPPPKDIETDYTKVLQSLFPCR